MNVLLVVFNETVVPKKVYNIPNDLVIFENDLKELKCDGMTSIYDALKFLFDNYKLAKKFMLTDGDENSSKYCNFS